MPDYAIYLRKSRKDNDAEQRGEGETLPISGNCCSITQSARDFT